MQANALTKLSSETKNPNSQWTADNIAMRFEECVSVFSRMPGQVRMDYVTFWPDIKYSRDELARHEKKKINHLPPLPEAIDRAEECLTWITWVNHGERNLIWLRAQRVSWRGISRETGFPRSSAQRYWEAALQKIADKLSELN